MISADAIRGYVDLMILALLRAEPSYAYAMARTIGETSQGTYAIKQTTLYSALKRLEGTGEVQSFPGQSESGKSRTYYRITPIGLEALNTKCAEWQATKNLVDRFVEGAL